MGNQADRPTQGVRSGRLILVKHARPALVPGEPPSTWLISPEGRADAQALAHKLAAFAPTAIVSSTELKATATADEMGAVLGLIPERDLALREHFGDTMAFFKEAVFQAKVAAFFASPRDLVLGEETGEEAYARFAGAVDRRRAAHPEGTLVLVAHGRDHPLGSTDARGRSDAVLAQPRPRLGGGGGRERPGLQDRLLEKKTPPA